MAIVDRGNHQLHMIVETSSISTYGGLEAISQVGLEAPEDNQDGLQDYPDNETVASQSSILSSADDRAKRLAFLIERKCPNFTIEPDIEPQARRISTASGLSRQMALDTLTRNKRNTPGFKHPAKGMKNILKSPKAKLNLSDPYNWQFSDQEKSQALRDAVADGMVDIAEAILDMGADVNTIIETAKSKILRRQSAAIRSTDYISTAASNNDVDMVALLASRGASSSHLEEALHIAVKHNLPRVVETLLQFNANPNALDGNVFKSAIMSQKPALVRLLLRARVKVLKRYVTRGLLSAVTGGQAEVVSILIKYEPDVDYENAAALRKAVQDQRVDLVLIIMRARPIISSVSSVFNDVSSVSSINEPLETRFLLFEILLCGGAQGDTVAETLIQLVRRRERSLVRLLVKHGASLQYRKAESLRLAVASGDIDLVGTLMSGQVSSKCAINRLNDIQRPFIHDRTHATMSILLSKAQGATGLALDKAIVVSVEQRLVDITKLLLNHRATVNYNNAQALQICASGGDLECFKLLLCKGRPLQSLMQHVLPQIPSDPHRLRYEMIKLVIDAAQPIGIPSPVLDVALMEAVDSPSGLVDLDLANLLLNAGADVNCLNGKCVQLATQRGFLELLELLARHNPQPASVSPAIADVMRIDQSSLRRKITALLLNHGARGSHVSEALRDALEECPIDEELAHLLLTKVNINDHVSRRSLAKAMVSAPVSMISSMIEIARPEKSTLIATLPTVLDYHTKDRQAKLELVLRTTVDQKDLDTALIQEINNGTACDLTIVKTLLGHGASCRHENSKAIELALLSKNVTLLQYLIESEPGHRTLASMLLIAMNEMVDRERFTFISMLLHGGAKGNEVSRSLILEVQRPSSCNLSIVELLVKHDARVDVAGGEAIKHAVSRPLHIEVLQALVRGRGISRIIESLIPLVMVHEQNMRLPLLSILLSNGARGDEVNAALIQAVSEGPDSLPTINLLLDNDALVDFNNGQAIKIAASNGFHSVLERLLNKPHNPAYRSEAMEMTMQGNSSNLPKRLSSVRLLTRSKVPRNATMHNALIQAILEQDHDLARHLVQEGADPNHQDGKSMIIAAEQTSIRSLEILAQAKPRQKYYSEAFKSIADDKRMEGVDSEMLLKVRKHLLQNGASGRAVDQTFLDYVTSPNLLRKELIEFALECPSALNVDFDCGKSLCTAAKGSNFGLVKRLLYLEPNESTLYAAFVSVLESGADETSLLTMVELFLKQAGDRKFIYFQENDLSLSPLYQVLHYHSNKPNLLRYLLDHGCPSDTPFTWDFMTGLGIEEVSPLLWLCCQADPNLDPRFVNILLKHGANPNFRTTSSGTSPLIIAAGAADQGVVLQLLEAQADPNTEDTFHRTPLYLATCAGNLTTMKLLLDREADPKDESLQIACEELDGAAVELLLDRGASVNAPGSNLSEFRTALEQLCCKANPDSNPAHLKATLKVLAKAKPNLKRLSHGMSILLQALNNPSPLAMTKALLAAFPTLCEMINEDYNIYHSNEDLCYSPTMYARHLKCVRSPHSNHDRRRACCEVPDCPAPQLTELLHAFGCEDRYWNPHAGANQPLGACGLPPEIRAAVQAAQDARAREAEAARVRAAEAQKQADEEARLEAEEIAAQEREARRREAAARRAREREDQKEKAFRKQRQRANALAEDKERYARKEADRLMTSMQKQAKIQSDLLREKERLVESATELARELHGQVSVGKILGEIGEGNRLMM